MAKLWKFRLAAAQRQKGYRAWMAMMDAKMEIDFLVFDVEGMPDDPYCEEGLHIAERTALERFPDKFAVVEPANRELSDKFIRFLGETFVQSFEGRWVNVPDIDGKQATPRVALPFNEMYLDPWTLTTAAMTRRTGDEWAFVYRCQREDYETWKEGRR